MLTDKDFDDIGKRLYDLEAEPPEKGWNRIAADIVPPPPGSGKQQTFAGRHWRKGMLLILTLTLYLMWPETKTKEVAPDLRVSGSRDQQEIASKGGRAEGTLKSDLGKELTSGSTNIRIESENVPGASAVCQQESDMSSYKIADAENRSIYREERLANGTERVSARALIRQEATMNSGGNETTERTSGGVQQPVHDSINRADNHNVIATPQDRKQPGEPIPNISDIEITRELAPNALADTFKAGLFKGETASDSTANEKIAIIGSSQNLKPSGEVEHNEKKTQSSIWRLTAAIAPQFAYRALSPIKNDEVLVTRVSTSSRYPEHAGLGLAIGAGKQVTRYTYFDGQLTYTQIRQSIGFSYTTGKIDTLLAVQGQQGQVRVVPVYEVADREQKSLLRYAGIRLTATHYFWLKGKRRFNISAGAGLNRVLSDKFKEKINGTWTESNHLSQKKINAHFVLAAGYNVSFGSGWEIMLNPTFTFYGKKTETNKQPFQQTHRSYGLNIMLSKSIP